ncbi:hypothetical protein PVAND_014285 [Polypedilum vanderplanki]|uniref:Metalloendopeptidase n=1 Tax=Polypedilum vanderplanki TaxID=319348 RepID=A0A9J6CT15_POLVA|nr:hypothetical protein PVAND_014285 [Polypedilum vanderplanki]
MTLDKFAVLLIFELVIGSVDNYKIYQFNTSNRDASLKYIITLPNNQRNTMKTFHSDPGTGIRNQRYRWPRLGNKIVVPFTLDSSADFTKLQIAKIYSAMRHISDRTCIKFKWRSTEIDYLSIYSGKWCMSYVGRIGGKQGLSLERSASCSNHIGTIIHELVHALGFFHMQNHANRDQYVSVINENISDDGVNQFQKIAAWEATNFGTPYDYFSIMHYGMYVFSKNGKPTILTHGGKYNQIIGQNSKLSEGDIKRIRNMYRCNCVEKRGYKMC